MAEIKTLTVHSSNVGELAVFENILPGKLTHVSYFNKKYIGLNDKIDNEWKALICLQGNCKINVEDQIFRLNKPNKVIILKPSDTFFLDSLSTNALVLVLQAKEFKRRKK